MALFESYDRRIDHINAVLNEYGINGIEDAKAICDAKGIALIQCVRKLNRSVSKRLLGLRSRCRYRYQERLYERCRGCRGYRYRFTGILYRWFCCG